MIVYMNTINSSEGKSANFLVYLVYAILLGPLSVVVLINQLVAHLSPTLSFVDLDQH